MKEKDLRRLSRADLLEMLIDQSKEVQILREKLEKAEAELKKREIAIQNAGSIAEASLMLNGVFEAAQAACREYVENTHKYCEPHGPFGAAVYEPPAYTRPQPPKSYEDFRGMPYDQYLQHSAMQPQMIETYERPMRNTFEPKKSSQRTARYRSTFDTPGWNDKR